MRLFIFPHNISKIAAARISKLDIEVFHHESWKPIYFGVKRSKVTVHKNSAGVGLYIPVTAGFFSFIKYSIYCMISRAVVGVTSGSSRRNKSYELISARRF